MSPVDSKRLVSFDVKTFVVLVTLLLGAGVGGTSLVQRAPAAPVEQTVCSSIADVARDLKEFRTSIAQLNVQMAVFAEQRDAMSKRLDKLEAGRK